MNHQIPATCCRIWCAQTQLHRAQVASLAINLRRLRAPQQTRTAAAQIVADS